MCSELNKLNSLPPVGRKWKFLLRGTAVFFALFAAVEIFTGIILDIYCFIPLDLLNIAGSIMLWRFSNAWRIYFVVMAALSVMLEWWIIDMLAIVPEETGILPYIIPAAMALHITAGIILVIYTLFLFFTGYFVGRRTKNGNDD